MTSLQPYRVWIPYPYSQIPAPISKQRVIQVIPNSLFRASIDHSAHIAMLGEQYILAQLGVGTVSLSQGGYWADLFAYVSPKARHTQYPQGLLLAAGFKQRPDARLPFAVIGVNPPTPIRGEGPSLEQFVMTATREYKQRALKQAPREQLILFYQALPAPPSARRQNTLKRP